MARPPGRSARPPLSVSPLEPRAVPAGMIDVQFLFNTVSVTGDAHDNHARVDLDEALVTVTSDTGPIRFTRMVGADFVTTVEPGPVVFWGTDFTHTSNCQFAMGAGDDTVELTGGAYWWDQIDVSTGKGDDRVFASLNNNTLRVDTGSGADVVALRDCGTLPSNFRPSVYVNAGAGGDRVAVTGTNRLATLWVDFLGGDDVLEGDPSPDASLVCGVLSAFGSVGHDRVVQSAYFTANQSWEFLDGFEEVS